MFSVALFFFLVISLNTRAFKFPHVIRVRGLKICNNRLGYELVISKTAQAIELDWLDVIITSYVQECITK